MSSTVNVRDIEALVDSFVRKGIAYAVALYPFFHSYEKAYINVVSTLEPAFGRDVAESIYRELSGAFSSVDLWTGVVVKGEKISLRDYLQKYILRDEVTRIIASEAEKRVNTMSEEDRRILSVASAIIDVLKTRSYPAVDVSYPSYRTKGIRVSSTDEDYFSKLVSSVLGVNIPNVRALFYKYLLGFQSDWESRRYYYHVLEIYPFAVPLLQSLAARVSNYINILDRFTVRSRLEELYRRGEYIKLAIIKRSLSIRSESEFLSLFSGKPYERICDEVIVEGIASKCFVNPLIYDNVKEAMDELYEKALSEFKAMIIDVFKREGYSVECVSDHCIFTKATSRPVHMYMYPWPEDSYFLEDFAGAIKAVVIQGIPVQTILQSRELQYHASRGYLWLFLEKGKIIVAPNTYRREDHYELLNILRNYFALEVIGPAPKELESLLTPAKSVAIEVAKAPSKPVQVVKRFSARDPLEDVVASVLKSLGFFVKVDHKIVSRAGTEVEVDVWAEKAVGDMRFAIYASCKN